MARLAKNPLNNERGAALMMAVIAMLLMIFLAVEISHETLVEYRVASGDYHRLKAFYAAKAGVELSQLRIRLYQQVAAQYGNTPQAKPLIDQVWRFPLSWPIKVPEDMTRMSKEDIQETEKQSLMDGQFIATIQGESGKLDINDLASPSEALRNAVKTQLAQIIQNRLTQDDDWARENQGLRVEELVNDIQDWVDADQDSQNGGGEEGRYPDAKSTFIPPNRPFKTLQELRMVRGMTEELYQLIAPAVTVYGVKGINVNYADEKVLMSIDPQITEEIAKEIVTRRDQPEYGPFKDEQDFQNYLGQQRVDMNKFNEAKIPLYFDAEYNFRIKSIGIYGDSTREIVAIIYDFDTIKGRFEKLLTASTTTTTVPGEGSGGAVTTTTVTTTTQAAPKGPPQMIYWYEE